MVGTPRDVTVRGSGAEARLSRDRAALIHAGVCDVIEHIAHGCGLTGETEATGALPEWATLGALATAPVQEVVVASLATTVGMSSDGLLPLYRRIDIESARTAEHGDIVVSLLDSYTSESGETIARFHVGSTGAAERAATFEVVLLPLTASLPERGEADKDGHLEA